MDNLILERCWLECIWSTNHIRPDLIKLRYCGEFLLSAFIVFMK